jgi:hypothetical protein
MIKKALPVLLGLGHVLSCTPQNGMPESESEPASSAMARPTTSGVHKLTIQYEEKDSIVAATLEGYARGGIMEIELFFDRVFPDSLTVQVLTDRGSFDAYALESWGIPETQCWMVGAAGVRTVALLSPLEWRPECDHDPNDDQHVRDVLVHELVHVFHMQHSPTDEFLGAEEIGWFVEGLATYVSGQLAASHADRARKAVEVGAVPSRLADAWSGEYRYGVAGSLAAFLDAKVGRVTFTRLLAATTQAQLLAPTGLLEEEFLEEWESWVRAGS